MSEQRDPCVAFLRLLGLLLGLSAVAVAGYRVGRTAGAEDWKRMAVKTSGVELDAEVDDLRLEVDMLERKMSSRLSEAEARVNELAAEKRELEQELRERATEIARLQFELSAKESECKAALRMRDEAVAALETQAIEAEHLLQLAAERNQKEQARLAAKVSSLETEVDQLTRSLPNQFSKVHSGGHGRHVSTALQARGAPQELEDPFGDSPVQTRAAGDDPFGW